MNDKCVYFHRLKCGRIFYVGIGSLRRAHSHLSRNRHWKFTVAKYIDYDVLIIAQNLTIAQAAEIEKIWIAHIGIARLTNISTGGEFSAYGMRHTDETKMRISINSASRRPENRLKLSVNNRGSRNPMFGRSHSTDARAKISKARQGSKADQKTKSKMSESHKGSRNAAFNPTIHSFVKDGRTISCTAYEFRKLTGIDQPSISMLVNGKRQTAKGWHHVK